MESDRDRLIREKAYALWEQRGRQEGGEHRDWLEAESSFAGGSEAPATEAPPGQAAESKPARKTAEHKAGTAAKKPAARTKPKG